MDSLDAVHRPLALVIVLLFFLLVCVAALAAQSGTAPGRSARVLGVVISAGVGVQALLGIVLAVGGRRPSNGLHFLVGPLVLFVLPVTLRLVGRAREDRKGAALMLGAMLGFSLALAAIGLGGRQG